MSTSDAIQRSYQQLDARGLRIGVVVSQFNDAITGKLLTGAKETLLERGVLENDIIITEVPGAFELPLAAQWLIETQQVNAVVTLGCVIRGETPHFDYVCAEAARGIQAVQLQTGTPVAFGVLTTDTEDQAVARTEPHRAGNKGADAALTALSMALLAKQLYPPTA